MERRLKVLQSAYACEPGKGSEPEVGWQWALQMARFHDVTVLTRANNEPAIRAGLENIPPEHRPKFIFHDLGGAWLRWKKKLRLHGLYYRRWQRSVREVVARAVAAEPFDLLHHVTYAGFRDEPAVMGQGVPWIWGPVGGIETLPSDLLPWSRPKDLAEEVSRNLNNAWQVKSGALEAKARAAVMTLASTREMQRAIVQTGADARLVPTIGLHLPPILERVRPRGGVLRLLYAGQWLCWKGVDLAITATVASKAQATLTLIGDGPMRRDLEGLIARLGVANIELRGRIPREELLRSYADFDALIFPSLHDSGGFVVIEAMAHGLPVICVDCGGPGLAVTPECGQKVLPGRRAQVINGLAAAIARYASDPDLLARHAAAARERVAAEYAWDKKGELMDAIYREAVAR